MVKSRRHLIWVGVVPAAWRVRGEAGGQVVVLCWGSGWML